MLEASGFDFRNRHPQKLLVKLAKHYAVPKESDLAIVAYCMSLDLNRTFSLLKQTTATMALACLELAARLLDDRLEEVESGNNYATWKTSREEVMGNSPHIITPFAYFLDYLSFSFIIISFVILILSPLSPRLPL